ncbi:MAG: hypothetical protein HOH95_03535 [Dehalococcoidia bacterium]|jgi:hypothetical protein|nr:hypothetical protein [Dehalococcoidia bacterium]
MSWIFYSLFSGLIPIVLVGLIIWGIVSFARRGGDEPEADPGIGTVRRLFIYGGALGGAFMGASGIALLLGGLIDVVGPGNLVVGDESTRLALALALTIVGAPVWGLFWWAGERSVREHPVELRSVMRRGYANLVRAVALVVVMSSGVSVARMLLRTDEFQGGAWGWALAWAGLWAVHELRIRAEPAPTTETRALDRLYFTFGSVIGLGAMAPAIGMAIYEPLRSSYDGALLDTVVRGDALWEGLRSALAVLLVAAPVWYWHWFRNAIRDVGSTLWRVYVFLFGVLGGLTAALVGTGALVHQLLVWALGASRDGTAEQFDVLPGALSAIVVGVAVWGYHRMTQRALAPATAERSESERVYRYVVAAAGLATLAAGLLVVFVLGVEAITPQADVFRDERWWRGRLAWALTLLLIGGPLWGWYWLNVQRQVASEPVVERLATSRRVYIFGVAGISVLVAAVNLVIVLFRMLEGVLESQLSSDDLHDLRWSIGLLLTTAVISVYHWLLLREDRAALVGVEPQAAAPTSKLVLLVATDGVGADLSRRLEALGSRVRRWQRLDRPDSGIRLSDEAVAALHGQITGSESEQVMVVVSAAGDAEVVPYSIV